MKITIVQPDIIWENRNANLEKIESLLDPVSGKTNLVILPEMFTTGFSMNTENLAEQFNADTLAWMRRISLERQFAICGSFIVDENHSFFNRFVFVTPDQKTYSYDKRHLFSIGGENDSYKPGKERLIFKYNDVRISAIICYDLRFPVWIRNRNDYDLMICVSNWPESRREVWNTLLKARAIENQCYVAGVNRVGSDNEGNNYSGESVILDPRGRKIADIKEYEEGIATGEISIPDLISFRKNFPVWKDADDFKINV
jgi:omega-amidase